jgi:ATP adenylyltransferase
MMENLWSPWRSTYITTNKEQDDGCFLCELAQSDTCTAQNLVVARFPRSFVVLNRFPYNAGHVMVVPTVHEGDMVKLDADVASEIMSTVQRTLGVMHTVLTPDGVNLGANLGEHAGAGVPGHVHMHLVPRWKGDTNFMPTIAETKVASAALEELWERFVDAFGA